MNQTWRCTFSRRRRVLCEYVFSLDSQNTRAQASPCVRGDDFEVRRCAAVWVQGVDSPCHQHEFRGVAWHLLRNIVCVRAQVCVCPVLQRWQSQLLNCLPAPLTSCLYRCLHSFPWRHQYVPNELGGWKTWKAIQSSQTELRVSRHRSICSFSYWIRCLN